MALGRSHLLTPTAPWILGFASDSTGLRELQRSLEAPGITARTLSGSQGRTAAGLLSEFASRLEFPGYFGGNWDSLDECLSDLGWLDGQAYVVLVESALFLLDSEPGSKLRLFARLIERVAAEWATPARRDDPRDRPVSAFHLLLQESPQNYGKLTARFADSGTTIAPFEFP